MGDSFDQLSKKPLVLLTLLKLLKLFPRSFEVLLPNPEPHLDRHRLKFSIIVTIATEVLKYRSESLAGTISSDNACSPVERACMCHYLGRRNNRLYLKELELFAFFYIYFNA